MQPHWLRLRGFRGIRDGLQRDELVLDIDRLAGDAALVALTGSNGRGKTTILDNLHPYLALPSRVASVGAAGFSYYDHVYLPESEKELIWSQGCSRYRTHIVIRSSGRRRTEAFLFVEDGQRWVPATLPDGTLSDGKVETYTRCISALCGRPETFFASAFSAQGRTRALSGYRNAECKELLADLLGQDELQRWGQQASEVVRAVKSGLALLRHQQTEDDQEADRLAGRRQLLADAPARLARSQSASEESAQALRSAQQAHAACVQEHRQAEGRHRERERLRARRTTIIGQGRAALTSLEQQDQREVERYSALQRRVAQRSARAHERRMELQRRIAELQRALQDAPASRRAARRLDLAGRIERLRGDRVAHARETAQAWEATCQALGRHAERLAEIEQAAGQATLAVEDLRQRVGLTARVPCAGSELQGRCPLLGDAHRAGTLIPGAQERIDGLAAARREVTAERDALEARSHALAGARGALVRAERASGRARRWLQTLAVRAARAPDMVQAERALEDARQSLEGLSCEHRGALPDEAEEERGIAATREAIATQRQRQAAEFRSALDAIDDSLRALPAPWPEGQLERSAASLADAEQAAEAARNAQAAAVRDVAALHAMEAQAQEHRARRSALRRRVGRVEQALGVWATFARCLGNDGLVALAIDEAGPALAELANVLLLACYGPRFTVSIHTQVATAKGETREGFEIEVHDADAGQSKSVTMTSGGERVWIDACLTRAVALYLAQQGGCRYETLFSDEADGALDPERKRMWMAMKREVLRLGGYTREFFISQTPELAAMADAAIDLDAMACEVGEAAPCNAAP